ncbi:cytochrome P450 [Actinoallomurus soli]|uniref:cytochrome P450 n=1 Tax=Actinoallomurus soli TaxID=2952535 RepID=UPI002093891D|nr:cytochrome P450 [Actinoallomurus soli]MCO5972916.1 cytochrome P450 [Actinoallomurus soli]
MIEPEPTIRPLGPPSPIPPDSVPLYGPRYDKENPARLYGELRSRNGEVLPILLEGDVPAWLILGYREVHQVLSDSTLFARDSRRWNQWENIPPDWPLMALVGYQPGSILFSEGAAHQRRAQAMTEAMAEVDRFELRARCERIADGLIDEFCGGDGAELMVQYASRIPALALAGMFGLPESEAWSIAEDVMAVLDGGEGALEAYQRFAGAMGRLLETKRAEPGPDVASRMLRHPAELTEEELTQDLLIMMIAGQDPTANWIGNTLRLMLIDDRFSLTLAGGRRSVGQAMNEVLWEESPAQNTFRWATRDTRLGGRRIRAGDAVVICLAGANSDPLVRTAPGTGARANHAHFSFGHGDHGCPFPAPELGEIIAETAVEVLLDRLPDVRLAVPPNELEWRPAFRVRALTALPVKFSPAPVRAMA